MKKVLFLVDDYWHREETIKPLVSVLFHQNEWNVIFTKEPKVLYDHSDIDLFLSFKDPIENDQIPTPIWCDEKWTKQILKLVKAGTGFIAVHAAVTDLAADHPIVTNLLHAVFVTHPTQCELSVRVLNEHPVTKGIRDFILPENDEHYQIKMLDSSNVTILAETISKNGVQPGLWISNYGKGRVCCFTPGHTTKNLTCDNYIKLLKNAIEWCCSEKVQVVSK